MEEKNQLAPKKPNKGILIVALVLLVVVLAFWIISRNNKSSEQAPLQNETSQENGQVSEGGLEAITPESPASIEGEEGTVGAIPGEGTPAEGDSEQANEAPIEKTNPITVKVTVGENGFSPASIDVKAGQEVTLSITANNGVSIIVFSNGIASATGISAGQTKDIKFNAPTTRGAYTFRNDVPTKGFTGTINVK